MYIQQKQLKNLIDNIKPNNVMLIFGPRRVGKTTLLNEYMKEINCKKMFVDGYDINIQEILSSQSIEKLKDFVGDTKFLAIDEAQKIPNVGSNLKLIVDHIKDIYIIATGSSSFDLAKNTGEPLTGRKTTLKLYTLSQMELNNTENKAETRANLEKRLLFGTYPEVVTANSDDERQKYLKEIVNSYLFKDILEIDGVKNSKKIVNILQLLAWQIGKEVSMAELGEQLGLSKNTVERYLDLLEKVFVIINIRGFSRNLRKEITKTSRYYFYDIGVRNALINNFNKLNLRNDVGMLWENYIIMERIKKQEYTGIFANNYFWRTYEKKEIDFVEEREGKLFGYEIKWGNKKEKAPKDWTQTYNNAEYKIINRDNYLEFIT